MENRETFMSIIIRSVHCFSLQFQSKLQSKNFIFPSWFKRPVVQNWTNCKCRMIRIIGSIIFTRNADHCMWGLKSPVRFFWEKASKTPVNLAPFFRNSFAKKVERIKQVSHDPSGGSPGTARLRSAALHFVDSAFISFLVSGRIHSVPCSVASPAFADLRFCSAPLQGLFLRLLRRRRKRPFRFAQNISASDQAGFLSGPSGNPFSAGSVRIALRPSVFTGLISGAFFAGCSSTGVSGMIAAFGLVSSRFYIQPRMSLLCESFFLLFVLIFCSEW